MRKLFIPAFLLLVLIAGCQRQSGDERAVRETVRRYNQLLAEGYSRMDMEPLMEVATREEFSRVLHHMTALKEAGLRLESKLKKLEFTGESITDPRTARVTTREIWDFAQVGTISGKDDLRAVDVVHFLSYDLVKNGEKWLVKRVVPLEAGQR